MGIQIEEYAVSILRLVTSIDVFIFRQQTDLSVTAFIPVITYL